MKGSKLRLLVYKLLSFLGPKYSFDCLIRTLSASQVIRYRAADCSHSAKKKKKWRSSIRLLCTRAATKLSEDNRLAPVLTTFKSVLKTFMCFEPPLTALHHKQSHPPILYLHFVLNILITLKKLSVLLFSILVFCFVFFYFLHFLCFYVLMHYVNHCGLRLCMRCALPSFKMTASWV